MTADPACDPALREDLEALAEHFAQQDTLKTIFINALVPWKDFVRPSNAGHAAVADFLITGAAASALSTNYDILIERSAWAYGADLHGALDGDEANIATGTRSPLLKFHGCAHRDRSETIWTRSQLGDATIASRIAKSKTWMAANLREKDLLVVGFWSDWSYFNDILGAAFRDVSPLSVTVVDLSSVDVLQAKAPDMWAAAHMPNVTFHHIQESGSAVLDEIRRAFSLGYLRKVLHAGREAFEADSGAVCVQAWLEIDDLGSEALYGLRRDAEGVPATAPAERKDPGQCELLGLFHLLLRRAGAVAHAEGYNLGGRTIRVVNGAGATLGRLKARFQEAPSVQTADVVVAVGAEDLLAPDNVVRAGRPGDIIRSAPLGTWVDFKEARGLLHI
jgi:hypothetical protein